MGLYEYGGSGGWLGLGERLTERWGIKSIVLHNRGLDYPSTPSFAENGLRRLSNVLRHLQEL